MQLPLQIAFHNMDASPEIESTIRAEVERLAHFHDRIMSCRVVVDMPHRHHRNGNLHQVRIDVKVPGHEIAVKREPGDDADSRVLDVAIHKAFDETLRRLEDLLRVQRGNVKAHEGQPHGRVARLFPQAGYGFLTTPDGREIYFHRNSVLNGSFRHLAVGVEVSFVEEEGDKGPQASTVHRVGRHGHAG
jgi:cold shock CspA family protein